MYRPVVLSLERPHEALGLRMPALRRVNESGVNKTLLFLFMLSTTIACMVFYMVQVNKSASQSFTLHTLERKSQHLEEQTSALEDQAVQLQTMQQLQNRVQGLGYVTVDQYEYIDATNPAYAVAK